MGRIKVYRVYKLHERGNYYVKHRSQTKVGKQRQWQRADRKTERDIERDREVDRQTSGQTVVPAPSELQQQQLPDRIGVSSI